MSDYCVLVADSARARLFSLEGAAIPGVESGPNLIEQLDLKNPEPVGPGRETWANTKSGRNTAPAGGGAHGYDDHRDQHEDEFLRRFARQVADRALEQLRGNGANRLVLVAANRMLGVLRVAIENTAPQGLEVRELAKDLVRMHAREIHAHLADAGVVPQRQQAVT